MSTPLPEFDAVVLAAGLGTRMKSRRPKVLHEAAGRPLLGHVLRTLGELGPKRTVVVIGAGAEQVSKFLDGSGVTTALQDPPRGTGDAVAKARAALEGSGRLVLILSGDVPLVRRETLERLLRVGAAAPGGALITARLDRPDSYGRVLRGAGGRLARMVEAKDATPEELAVDEVNAGLYALPEKELWPRLAALTTDNAQGEYYLTDAVMAMAPLGVEPVLLDDPVEMSGVNNRVELAEVGRVLHRRSLDRLMTEGVTILDPATTFVDDTVTIGADSVIHPFVRLEGATRIGEGAVVRSYCRVTNVTIGDGAELLEGVIAADATVGARAHVGPWAHLRPGTELGDDVKVGNFVETKKARFGKGAKASHLSYLGDAEIGEGVNIGAGTITCNYDGVNKHKTVLGDGVFIGSDTQLVAPVTVGAGAYVGAGSTITKDVPAGALAISRTPQKNVEGWADRKSKKKGNPG